MHARTHTHTHTYTHTHIYIYIYTYFYPVVIVHDFTHTHTHTHTPTTTTYRKDQRKNLHTMFVCLFVCLFVIVATRGRANRKITGPKNLRLNKQTSTIIVLSVDPTYSSMDMIDTKCPLPFVVSFNS